MSGRQVPGSQVSGRQISGNQVSGRQISGSQASGRQKRQPTNRLLLSGRQASQEGPARQRTTPATKGNSEQLKSSQQRAGLARQGSRQGSNSRQGSSSRQQVLRRAVSSPKLDLIPEQGGNHVMGGKGGGGNSSQVPRLQLDFSGSSASTVVPHANRRRAGERNRFVFQAVAWLEVGSDFHTNQ